MGHIHNRMRNGRLTERALARQLGISQSHVNNVLRGRRNLSHELADAILRYFNYSLLDLYLESEHADTGDAAANEEPSVSVPLLKDPVGPGRAWSTVRLNVEYAVPRQVGMVECAALARLMPDLQMAPSLCGSDIALLDLSVRARLRDAPSAMFVVRRGNDTALRWLRTGAGKLYVADDHNLNHPVKWEAMAMDRERRAEFVKGRVLWVGRESDLKRSLDIEPHSSRAGLA